jgi:alpha-methylacyl-CoA racemase
MNYIAITGALHAIGTTEKPIPPLNLVGDFGGGALYLAFGLLAGVIQARETGKGQVIDCAMSDGAASLMAMFYGMKATGMWKDERRANMLDGGAHFYDTYQCSDGKWISAGSIEPQFYACCSRRPASTTRTSSGRWTAPSGRTCTTSWPT